MNLTAGFCTSDVDAASDMSSLNEAILNFYNSGNNIPLHIDMSDCTDYSTFASFTLEDNPNIDAIKFPPNITFIPANFMCRTGIQKIVLPDTVSSVGSKAFSECESLEYVYIGKADVTGGGGIASTCFYKSFNISKFEANPNNSYCKVHEQAESMIVSKTGSYLYIDGFQQEDGTKILPEGIKTLGLSVYQDSPLEKIILPYSTNIISKQCFYNCPDIEITIPERVYKIGTGAFYGCNPSNITIEGLSTWSYGSDSNLSIVETDFIDNITQRLTTDEIVNATSYSRNNVCTPYIREETYGGSSNKERNVLIVNINAKKDTPCSIMYSFMPSNNTAAPTLITSDDFEAFRTSFSVYQDTAPIVLDLYEASNTELEDSCFIINTGVVFETIVLPNGLQKINRQSFYGSSIRKIKIPSSVKTIEYNAFANCSNLTEITFEDPEDWCDGDNNTIPNETALIEELRSGGELHKN